MALLYGTCYHNSKEKCQEEWENEKGWQQSADGRWWYGTNGENSSWYADGWRGLKEGEGDVCKYYYFDEQGYVLTNTVTPDGHQVNEKGEYVIDGVVQIEPWDGPVPETLKNEKRAIRTDHVINPTLRTTARGWFQAADGSWKYGINGECIVGTSWIANDSGKMEFYWFDDNGVMQTNVTSSGRTYNADGKWEKDGQVVTVDNPSDSGLIVSDSKMASLLKINDPDAYNRIYGGGSSSGSGSSPSSSGGSSSGSGKPSSGSGDLKWEGEWTEEHRREYLLEREIYNRIGLEYSLSDYIRKHSH